MRGKLRNGIRLQTRRQGNSCKIGARVDLKFPTKTHMDAFVP